MIKIRPLPILAGLALVCAPFVINGCKNQSAPPTPTQLHWTVANNGQTASLAVGDTVEVVLESNGSTGYSWMLSAAPASTVAENTGHESEGPKAANAPPGAPGEERWTFRATGAGTTEVTLAYQRPGDKTPGNTFHFTIQVHAP